jgi:cell division septal protein FtsQ
MSSLFDSTAPKFFRPNDVGSIQRNQRRINVQRAARVGRNVALAAAVSALVLWGYHRALSSTRFAVKTIEVSGATHTSREALEAVTSAYAGVNLFKIDISRVQSDVHALPWVSRVEIEKKLPDTLRIRVVERTPWALVESGTGLRYADENGVPFAPLTPSVGDPDLPIVVATDAADVQRCVQLVRDLHQRDPLLYSRISEVRPVAPHGFALFDRDLGAVIYADQETLSAKWRTLYGIANAERFGRAEIEYADLRFADRIVLKPVHPIATSAAAIVPAQTAEITN